MAVKQTVVLNFKTQLDQAKTDILSLADLYKKSMIAPGQEGALSSPERLAVADVASQRAIESGISPEEMNKVLEDVNQILEKEEGIRQRLSELSIKREDTEKRITEREAEKVQLIAQAAQLMGLRKDANLQEVIAAKEKLALEIEGGKASKEQIATYNTLNDLLGQVGTKNRSLGQLVRNNTDIIGQQTAALNEQDDIFVKLRQALIEINITEDERTEIERKLLPVLIDQTTQIKALEVAQKKSVAAAKENDKAQKDINNSLKKMPVTFAEKATSAFLYFQAVQAIRRVVRAAVQTLVELDKALTDISIVTNMNRQETQQMIGAYQEMAKRVGLTTTEVVNLSTAFFRQGREAADALKLTETAAQFARIAAINVNDASNFLTAAINGFNLAANDATRIIDRFAALGAGAAASAQEIAVALSKVAPAAASAGVGIDNLMAFVTKAIETTREAPENIGTAFKTIFARMRQLTDIGKTLEDGMDVNNVEKALRNIGVELRDASGEFRDLDKVLIDVGYKWDSITRSQQAYIATTLAGTRQQTRLIALFENFDRTLELIDVSQRSAGAAAIQHAEFMQGLEAATTNLKTSFQAFITSISNSDQMLFVIDALRTGIDLLNTVFGKLILTGVVFKTLMLAQASPTSKFRQAIDATTAALGKLSTSKIGNAAANALLNQSTIASSVAMGMNKGLLDQQIIKTPIFTKLLNKTTMAITGQSLAT
jgi:TP901 family phage tail tape measure protein